ncbi:TPA: lipoprotein [Enterobacter cancerogenus]|uniref:hypothetical protein n=1 Tax=Enterobacter cancerogenus TaxID=69218 RepID=UPI0001826384|nr:hypothetical protein [Enterobacter cancerogenus]EFC57506.1 hypothetical protein ENTCAN_06023 [Enterobacter cancerogenus ATCC 35316]
MSKLPFFIFLLFLTGCPGKGREGEASGIRQSIYIDRNYVCFTVDKKRILSRFILSTNGKHYKELLKGDFLHLSYPGTCFTVNLDRGIVYGTSYTIDNNNYYYTFIIDQEGNVVDLGEK